MKKISLLALLCFFSLMSFSKHTSVTIKETPAKTICIKHPDANKPNFFSTISVLSFEVYKPDSKTDIVTVVETLRKHAGIQSCELGKQTGDYYRVNIILSKPMDKAWFVKAFKEAGLTMIKLNNAEAVSLDTL